MALDSINTRARVCELAESGSLPTCDHVNRHKFSYPCPAASTSCSVSRIITWEHGQSDGRSNTRK
jgi:hypothetical protein